ncbi:MAG: hypothetical protein R3178_09480 [Rhodothermales bacterium]|nr:hypothetical protein [Rhodothermales bacterium]
MASRKRRGMIIKNTHLKAVEIAMKSRTIVVEPGQELLLTAEEVRDPILREHLQVRSVSIVRPATEEEEQEFRKKQGSKA